MSLAQVSCTTPPGEHGSHLRKSLCTTLPGEHITRASYLHNSTWRTCHSGKSLANSIWRTFKSLAQVTCRTLPGEHVTRASHLHKSTSSHFYNHTWRTCKSLAQVTCSTSASYSHKYCRTKSLAQVQFYLENMQLTRTSHLHNPNWRGTSHSRKSPVKLFLENTHVTLARHVMYSAS